MRSRSRWCPSQRLRILGLLRREPRTLKQLVAELDLPTTRLYYHVNLLESHGLIRAVETRIVFAFTISELTRVERYLSADAHAASQVRDTATTLA